MLPSDVRAALTAYEDARRAGASAAELRAIYQPIKAILAAHFEAARQSSNWQAPQAPAAVKVRAAARPAPAA